jgi:hypothetical protein
MRRRRAEKEERKKDSKRLRKVKKTEGKGKGGREDDWSIPLEKENRRKRTRAGTLC